MQKWEQIKLWFKRLVSFEYWPWWIFYIPTLPYGLFLAAKARTLMYFSVVNPCMENSGVVGFSKYKILRQIPEAFIPKTLFFQYPTNFTHLLDEVKRTGIQFPFIIKPDKGERGRGVELIENELNLRIYLSQIREDFMVQSYIDHPIEMGVFYYRLPDSNHGTISSVVYKKYLSVVGDGKSTLQELVKSNTRAAIRYEYLKNKFAEEWFTVVPNGKEIHLEPIGNHMRGTEFKNGMHLLNSRMLQVFDEISVQIEGFYYGRYDLKVPSFDDLYGGKNIMVMELNGVSAEPAHIFAKDVSLIQAYKIIFRHMKIIYEIGAINHGKGEQYLGFNDFFKIVFAHYEKKPPIMSAEIQEINLPKTKV